MDAMKWLKEHHFKRKKVDITKNWFRYRLLEPFELKKQGYTHYVNKYMYGSYTLELSADDGFIDFMTKKITTLLQTFKNQSICALLLDRTFYI